MIKVILLLAVIALGADAILNGGAYTRAAWQELTSYVVRIEGSGSDPKPPGDKPL
jgi:hypothetical protein